MILYMYIAPGQGLTTPWGWNCDVNWNNLSLRSFVSKQISEVWFYTIFFMILYMYIAPGQGQTAPREHNFDVSRNVLSLHLLQVPKKYFRSLILYNFFHDLIHVYSPGAEADSPQWTKFWCQQKGLSDRSKAVLLLWFLTVTCSCCPYLYFGSAVMFMI